MIDNDVMMLRFFMKNKSGRRGCRKGDDARFTALDTSRAIASLVVSVCKFFTQTLLFPIHRTGYFWSDALFKAPLCILL